MSNPTLPVKSHPSPFFNKMMSMMMMMAMMMIMMIMMMMLLKKILYSCYKKVSSISEELNNRWVACGQGGRC